MPIRWTRALNRLGEFWVSSSAIVLAASWQIVGLLFLDWDLAGIMVFLWWENLIVGVVTVAQLLLISASSRVWLDRPRSDWLVRVGNVPFFVLVFTVLLMMQTLFMSPALTVADLVETLTWGARVTVVLLLWEYGSSFVVNFVGRREYLRSTVKEVMGRSFLRAFILMVVFTPLISFAAISKAGAWVGVVSILLKLPIDLFIHAKDREGDTLFDDFPL